MDAEQSSDVDPVARLFAHFPARGVLGILAGIEPAAGKGPRGSASLVPMGEKDAVVEIQTATEQGSATGSGFRMIWLNSEKMAALAPMPRPSDRIATAVTNGVLKSVLRASFRLNMWRLDGYGRRQVVRKGPSLPAYALRAMAGKPVVTTKAIGRVVIDHASGLHERVTDR